MWPAESQPKFWRNMSPPSPGFNSRRSKRLAWNRQQILVSSPLKIEDACSFEMLIKFQQVTCYYRCMHMHTHTHTHSIRVLVIMHPKLYFAECRSENWCHRSRVLEIVNMIWWHDKNTCCHESNLSYWAWKGSFIELKAKDSGEWHETSVGWWEPSQSR